ncbi:hypothetical protein A4S06_09280 [Erysipelotrichaceae bacterium MTC7]|nr:hypothetical protein A4S06_09280 [Erysipelotrichaceae bacterium MTC7]
MQKNIGRLVSIVYRKRQSIINSLFQEENLPNAEVSILLHLYGNDGLSQEKLTKYLSIDKAAIARSISSLETKGYLRRVKNPKDKREYQIHLTKLGMDSEVLVKGKLDRLNESLLDGVSQKDIDIAYDVLTNIVNNLGIKLQEERK